MALSTIPGAALSWKPIFRFAFMVLVACTMVASAFPCSCMRIGPPCEAAWLQADAVFVGRVYWTSLLPTKRLGVETLHRIARVKNLEPFIGDIPRWVNVETGAGGGDCGYEFKWGEKYVIYAHRNPDGSLTTSICTRTQKVSEASSDLKYLRTMKTLPDKGRVYGTVKQYTFDPNFEPIEVSIMSPYGSGPEEKVVSMRALPNTAVHLKRPDAAAEQNVHAGQSGEFAFENLTPGRYTISVDLPQQMRPWESRSIIVPAKGCSEINVRTAFNGRLSGRVTDREGAAIPYVAVEVVRASEADKAERPFRWLNADKNGAFEIGPLPPDVYVLGVNIVKYSGDRTRPRTYYPGTSNLREAKQIRLGEGQLVKQLDFQLVLIPPHPQP